MGQNSSTLQDNNHSVAFEGGFGLNLLDGSLTVLGLSFPRDPGNLGDGHTTYFEVTGV